MEQFPDTYLASAIAAWLNKDIIETFTIDEINDKLATSNGHLPNNIFGNVSNIQGFEIFSNTNLTHLYIRDSNLNGIHLNYLNYLVGLDISGNETLNYIFLDGMNNLEYLYVNDNSLDGFPVGILNIPTLISFDISNNPIDFMNVSNIDIHNELMNRLGVNYQPPIPN